jgi:hypothetical protein
MFYIIERGKMIIKKIGVLSVAKITFFIMILFGILIGVIFGFTSQLLAQSIGLSNVSLIGLWIISLIVIPISVSIISVLGAIIITTLYNLIADLTGGINIDLVENSPKIV